MGYRLVGLDRLGRLGGFCPVCAIDGVYARERAVMGPVDAVENRSVLRGVRFVPTMKVVRLCHLHRRQIEETRMGQLLSIVIPVYNERDLLPQVLDKVEQVELPGAGLNARS